MFSTPYVDPALAFKRQFAPNPQGLACLQGERRCRCSHAELGTSGKSQVLTRPPPPQAGDTTPCYRCPKLAMGVAPQALPAINRQPRDHPLRRPMRTCHEHYVGGQLNCI